MKQNEKIIFEEGKLKIRELKESDAQELVKWLSDPIVLEYYEGRDHIFNYQMVQEKFYSFNARKTRCLIEYCGIKIGYLQYYILVDNELEIYGNKNSNELCYGMDQFIGEPDYWNKGIGTKLMKGIVKYLVEVKKAKKIFVDPQCRNKRAIKCYEKSGFTKLQVLDEHELHEGKLESCYLMEYTQNNL